MSRTTKNKETEPNGFATMRVSSLLILLVVCLTSLAGWGIANRPVETPPAFGNIAGLSFSPFREGDTPRGKIYPSREEIDEDLALVARETGAIRTYSLEGTLVHVPELAARHDINVTLGAWISADLDRNMREMSELVRQANSHRSVVRAMVGNEALLREEIPVNNLIAYIRAVRAAVEVPVSTAEPWHVWLKHPELAREVDFLGVHILPYWEGVPAEEAVGYTLQRMEELRRAFPGKPIVLTEVGWPSNGKAIEAAEASEVAQTQFLRHFLTTAKMRGIDYFVIEAFDQPWKQVEEGAAGAYWGIFDVERNPKYEPSGPVQELDSWPLWATLATLLGALPAALYLRRRPYLSWHGRLFFAGVMQLAGSAFVWSLTNTAEQYLSAFGASITAFLLLAQALMLGVIIADSLELTDVLWNRRRRRSTRIPQSLRRSKARPKVSIHVPCYNEPPEMVKRTLDALSRLDYPDFEVLLIDNNTKDPAVWRPVEEHCRTLGERFRFFHLDNWPGFKAGALNFALARTDAAAEIVAVIDSDYEVSPDWLSQLAPAFAEPRIGIVQAPQDYSDEGQSLFKRLCYWEYAGFFHIGMVQRNEANAIIQHGTMTMVRKQALAEVGGWSEWCITEDAELGLKLFRRGWEALYVNRSFGKGLMPDSISGYKSQRFRWAYGAVMILRQHWRAFLPGKASGLTWAQRYHFIAGWAPWFADALGLVFTLAAIFWSFAMAVEPRLFEVPLPFFLWPTLCVFGFKFLRGLWLYRRRVPCHLRDRLGAALAGLALYHTVAKSMLYGIFTRRLPFQRTPKCEDKPALLRGLLMAREEAAILALQISAMLAFALRQETQSEETWLWLGIVAVQTMPYLAALSLSMINAGPVAWPRLRGRVAISKPAEAAR